MATRPTSTQPRLAASDAHLAAVVPAWLACVRAYNLCEDAMSQRLDLLGVDLGTHEILINLQQAPGLSQQILARRCFTTKSNISMLVTRLEKGGLLARQSDPADARAHKLVLTTKGRTLAVKCRAIQEDVVATMTAGCTADEIAVLLRTMQRASVALEGMLDGR